MTACPDRAMLLQGLLDGELDAANASDCEAHLKSCAACQEAFLRLQAVREAVASPAVAYSAPASLRAGVDAALAAGATAAPPPRRRIAPPWLGFGAAGALAAAGGILYSLSYQSIDPLMGILPGLKAFVAAVLGGIGNIPGAALGGLMLGIIETFFNGSRWSTYTDAIAFALLILVLLFKPSGLLGKNQVEKV